MGWCRAVAGGKAANLGELIRAGFPVPDGFCLTTAAYASACDTPHLAALLEELAAIRSDERMRLTELAEAMRAVTAEAPLPRAVIKALTEAYQALVQEQPNRQAAREAEAMVAELTRRATRRGRLRGLIVGFCLRRARALGGLREMPRFMIALLLARARTLLWPVGEELARCGRLDAAGDIFFLTLPEGQEALAGTDMRARVRERRANDDREGARRHVPLVLLSDGTEPSAASSVAGSSQQCLQGTPASPGVVTATARVILDPRDANLLPGEILVAPSTDPGWTPLFLTAGGLVMEMGGAMAHGAIVAREYGIPAVVGVRGAMECIPTGSRITVDGAAGTVSIE